MSPSCVVVPLFLITSSTCARVCLGGWGVHVCVCVCVSRDSTRTSRCTTHHGMHGGHQNVHHATLAATAHTFFCVARSLLCVVSTSSSSSSSIWPCGCMHVSAHKVLVC
jgi:hypothetical protein